jgi:hypothetical protein
MPSLASVCWNCPPPLQGQIGPRGAQGVAGPVTQTALLAVGGVVGATMCGTPVTRSATGILQFTFGANGLGCINNLPGVIVDPGSPIPGSVSATGVQFGPVDALSTTQITNFCQAVGTCASGGLTPAGAAITAGLGLVAMGNQLAVGDDATSPIPYAVTTAGLQIGPVAASAVSGLCAAVLACVQAGPAPYQAAIVTTAAVCAAGAVTQVGGTATVDLTLTGCQLTADVKVNPGSLLPITTAGGLAVSVAGDPASPLPVSVSNAGIAVGLPTPAQLCPLIQTCTLPIANITGVSSANNGITIAGGVWTLQTGSTTFKTGVCAHLASLASGGAASPGTTLLVGADCQLYTLPAAGTETVITAGPGITASGASNHTVQVNRADLFTAGSGLAAGAGAVDLRVNWCDGFNAGTVSSGQLFVRATGEAACKQTALAGPDCTTTVRSILGIGRRTATEWGQTKNVVRLDYRSINASGALNPAADSVLGVDTAAGNVTVTLAAPGACDPVDFHIKKLASANTMTIAAQAGATIDGMSSVTVGAGTTGFGGFPSVHVMWNGTGWLIL